MRNDIQRDNIEKVVSFFLWEIEAVKVSINEPFRLVSGSLSPIYINCRRLISCPAAMNFIVAYINWWQLRYSIEVDVIAGGETAGIVFASYVAQHLAKPMVYVRKKPKDYGTGDLVEGIIKEGQRVVLVEDLITDGGSKKVFIEGLRDAGAIVEHCIVIFDRQQGGAEFLANMGVKLFSLCTMREVLNRGEIWGNLPVSAKAEVLQYLNDPNAWNLKRCPTEP